MRELERQLGHKALEVELLKAGLERTRAKKDLVVALCVERRFPVKAVADTLVVARSNVADRAKGVRAKRGPQTGQGDLELAAAIRRLVDTRPIYSYRWIAALIKRERRCGGGTPVNAKRVYQLMKKHDLLLARHTGRRLARWQRRDAPVRYRWCSDGLEFIRWNGEIVRVAFVLDCHDREVIGWIITTAGISGEMIRDLMVECVERCFNAVRTRSRPVDRR